MSVRSLTNFTFYILITEAWQIMPLTDQQSDYVLKKVTFSAELLQGTQKIMKLVFHEFPGSVRTPIYHHC